MKLNKIKNEDLKDENIFAIDNITKLIGEIRRVNDITRINILLNQQKKKIIAALNANKIPIPPLLI